MYYFLILLLALALAFGLYFMLRHRDKESPDCPNCGKNALCELSREQVDSQTVEYHGGGTGGGGDIRVRLGYNVMYECQNCHERVTLKQLETQ